MKFINILFGFALLTSLIACTEEEDAAAALTGQTTTFPLFSMNDSGISGILTVNELNDNTVQVVVDTENSSSRGVEVTVYTLSGAEEGEKVLVLNDIQDDGLSATIVSKWQNQTALSYTDFIEFNGHLQIKATDEGNELLAIADLGDLALTGRETAYPLVDAGNTGITGSITYHERKNGTTFVVMKLDQKTPNGLHPSHIHIGDIDMSEDVEIAMMLKPVNGNFAYGYSQIEVFGEGQQAISYEEMLQFDGHIKVHAAMDDKQVLTTGNIGKNAF